MITYEEFLALLGGEAENVTRETYEELVGNKEDNE